MTRLLYSNPQAPSQVGESDGAALAASAISASALASGASDTTGATDASPPPAAAANADGTQSKQKYRTVTTEVPLPLQLTSKAAPSRGETANPAKRGDFVSFSRAKKGAKGITNIKVVKGADKAATVKGKTTSLTSSGGVLATSTTAYPFTFEKVVSCEGKVLKEGDEIEAILYEGEIYGIARTKDLYLTSRVNTGKEASTERQKLNLTVKSELKNMGGQIMAQSSMAVGPDGTIGFKAGWTSRLSKFVQEFVPASEAPPPPEKEKKEEEEDKVEKIILPTTELKVNSRAMQRF